MKKEIKLYNNTVSIFFEERDWAGKKIHSYTDHKGKIISVTEVTGKIDKSAVLQAWTAKMMGLYLLKKGGVITYELIEEAKKEYRRLTAEAADIGTEIHKWAEDWIAGKKPEIPDNEKVANGITAFLKFNKDNKIKWIESERLVYSKKHKYCGKLDAIGIMNDRLTLIDFKSSNGIYDEMYLQVAGYQIAYEEETNKKIERKIIARFGKEDGEFEIRELENNGKDEKAFLAQLIVVKRLKELEKDAKNRY